MYKAKAYIYIVFLLSILSIGGFVMSEHARAAFNEEINYQGKLLDNTGATVADGLYDMEFKLYTVPTGGTAIWTETLTLSNQVQVTSGLFSVMLGSTTPLTNVDFDQTLYLGVKIESDLEMTPRKVLGAVPAAFEANHADTADSADAVGGVASSSFLRSDASDSFTAGTLTFDAGTALIVNGTGQFANATSTDFYTTTFGLNNEYFTDLTGTGLSNTAGVLTLSAALDDLTDVDTTGAAFGNLLSYNGASWEDVATSTLGIAISDLIGDTDDLSEGSSNLFSQWDMATGGINFAGGNVGIGTTTPYAKLSLTNTSAGPSFVVEDSASPDETHFIIDSIGNVGINGDPLWEADLTLGSMDAEILFGTSTGAMRASIYRDAVDDDTGDLTVHPGFENALKVEYGSGGGSAIAAFRITEEAGQDILTIGDRADGTESTLNFLDSDNGSKFYIDKDGRIGVSSSTPYAKLALTGTAGQSNPLFQIASSTNNPYLTVSSLGALSLTSGATTTASNGFNIADGCYAVDGTCIGGSAVAALNDLTDVDTTGAGFGNLLSYDGANWVDTATSALAIALSDTTGTLAVNKGGTGLATFGGANTVLYTTSADTLASDPGFTFDGSNLSLADDYALRLGGGNDAKFVWETTDANANALNLILPEGDATNIPALVIGDSSIDNVDLAAFNGETEPQIILTDDAATQFTRLRHSLLFSSQNLNLQSNDDVVLTSGSQAGDRIAFQTLGGTERMAILSDGNVGIGTTSPYAKLSLTGTAGQDNPLFQIASSTETPYLTVSSLGALTLSSSATTTADNGFNITDGCYAIDGTCIGGGGSGSGTVNSGTAGRLAFYPSSDTTVDDTDGLFFDDTNDRFGVGTTTPWGKLSVSYDASSDTGPRFVIGSSTATNLIVEASGNVSIDEGKFYHDISTGETSISNLVLGPTRFDTDAGRVVWVDLPVTSAGAGTVEAYSAQIDSTDVLVVYGESDGSGGAQNLRVGIGTSTPSSLGTLAIEGNLYVSSTTASSTFGNGINITGGCFAVNGTCVGGSSVAALNDLTDVDTTAAAFGNLLSYNGATWEDVATSTLSINTDDLVEGASNLFYTDARVNSHLSGVTGVTYNDGAISFDCSEVEGTGINCATESITLDATGAWTGTFDGQEGSFYLSRANHTGTQAASTISDFVEVSQDTAGGMVTGNTETDITVTYQDADGTLDFVVDTLPNLTGTLDVNSGGTGAATLTGLLQGNGTGAFTAISNSSTVGQVLRVTGASAYAWGALNLADSDAITGTLPVGNGGTGVTTFGGTNTVLYTSSANTLTSNANFVFDGTNFGIGTSSPAAMLAVDGTGIFTGVLDLQGATTTAVNGFNISDGCYAVDGTCIGGGSGSGTVNTGTGGRLAFYPSTGTTVDDSDGLFYDDTNNRFGVGSSTPWGKLSVNYADATDTGPRFVVGSSTQTNLVVESTGNLSVDEGKIYHDVSSGETSISNLNLGPIKFDDNAGWVSWIDMDVLSGVATDTIEAYSAQLDGNQLLTLWSNTVDDDGTLGDTRVLIGTTTNTVLASSNIPNNSMIIGNGALCVDGGSGGCDDSARAAGGIYAESNSITGLDLAEMYPVRVGTSSPELPAAGEIVSLVPEEANICTEFDIMTPGAPACIAQATSTVPFVARAGEDEENAGTLFGIVSTKPGVILGGFDAQHLAIYERVPIALAGRVPVKVNLDGGEIKPGDHIALSSVPGVGMKATTSGMTIGIALEGFGETGGDEDDEAGDAIETDEQESADESDDENATTTATSTDDSTDESNDSESEDEEEGTILVLVDTSFAFIGADLALMTGEEISQDDIEDLNSEGDPSDASASSTDAHARPTGIIGGFLAAIERFGVIIRDGMTSIVNLAAIALTVGSSEQPAGITLFDEETGEPYCLSISGGEMVSRPGSCEKQGENAEGNAVPVEKKPAAKKPSGNSHENANTTPDETPPSIEVLGGNPIEVVVGGTYADPGVKASDNRDAGLTVTYAIDGQAVDSISINTSVVAEYAITYTAVDNAGNSTLAERTVKVVAQADAIPEETPESAPEETEEAPPLPEEEEKVGPEIEEQPPIENATQDPAADEGEVDPEASVEPATQSSVDQPQS